MSVDNVKREQKIISEDCSNEKNEKNIEQNIVNSVMNAKEMSEIKCTSLDNGLDPIGIELISAGLELNNDIISSDTMIDIKDDSILKESNETNLHGKSTELIFDESTVSHSRMSREMRNLQKSTQDSKVLSNYLNDFDSPRIRNRKTKETNSSANDTELINESMSLMIDKEIPLKRGNNENDDSDSTVIVRDEIGKKRRRSISRSRTSRTAHRSKSVAARTKSLSRLLSDEMAVTSDKEDNHDEDEIDDMTNTIIMNIKPIENRAMNPPPKLGWDSFCFKCHLDNAVLSLACRKYHESYESDIQFKSTKESNQPLIVTQISLKRIEERIMNNYYKVSEAFLHDIKQLEHNWTIIDKSKTKSLKNILKFVVTEINEMEACVYCYSNSFVMSNWFTIPCKRPHLLIWAKLKGYPYWPAKVMSIDNQKLYADVRFFGAHDRAWVPTAHCLIFSEKDPNKMARNSSPNNNKGTTKTQKGIADAIKEKDEYIQNIRDKYGFRFANSRELLDATMFQTQLENQLSNLKKDSSEKNENESNQKEKLTLKIVKTSDGSQTIEQKNTKNNQERDKHILYRVLSRNEDGYESSDQSRVKTIILKRNVEGDSEREKLKRSNMGNPETPDVNLSLSFHDDSAVKIRSVREDLKQNKVIRHLKSRSTTPDTQLKKKTKIVDIDEENDLLEELPEKPTKKIRKNFSNEIPLILTANNHNVPSGTHEIHSLSEKSFTVSRSKSNCFNRSKSVDKESIKQDNFVRRLSANSTIHSSTREISILKNNASIKAHLQFNRSVSQSLSSSSTPLSGSTNHTTNDNGDNLHLNIKNEPLSDEEIVERNQFTVNDIPKLVSEGNNKRKTILISTSDNSNDSFPSNSRARKSFPNSLVMTHRKVGSLDVSPIKNTNAMVCIPQVFPLNGINSEIPKSPTNNELERTDTSDDIRRKSVIFTQQSSNTYQIDLPSLIPKPSGVFTSEGNTFSHESGAVSALFSENAHRMTDYFKSLLIDTISAVSSGVSDAQNVLLKLELEKTKQQLHNLRNDNQLKIENLRKEHADEIRILKMSYDEKIKIIQQNIDQDKIKLISEIRQQCEIEKQRAIESTKREVKRVTWCSNCTKEARFYCCWNTSYCGPSCQKVHWQTHQKYCTNRNTTTTENPLQNSNNFIRQNALDNITSVTSSANSQYIPVTISLPFSNKTLMRTIAVPKQNPLSVVAQQSSTIGDCNKFENSHTIQNPAQHTFIQTGQKTIIQTITTPTYVIQQHKISPAVSSTALRAISSTLANEQSLTSNFVVRAIPQNDSPPLTLVSTTKKNMDNTPLSNDNSSTDYSIKNSPVIKISSEPLK
ncbi:MYND-type zinc finger-containing chromatin reader Zmynd8-like isoform X2 [Chironomus tepperi]|uniref:MYND-type zinc finger-containing chromatin reader Zmynd8-like isoform X2 n=1 Tax=Chironomus tepperi TaxID=113505 RepID=UPI00391F43FD